MARLEAVAGLEVVVRPEAVAVGIGISTDPYR
jgi:hypothetical protein